MGVLALAVLGMTAAAARPVVSRNLGVQALRGVAALAVMLFHARGSIAAGTPWPFDERFGILGVAVFFAISGMLMAELVARTEPWQFLSHRVVRIYPLYFILVATWAVVAPTFGVQRVGFHLLSLTLAPVGWRYFYLGPEWTLVYECSYYVILFALAWAGHQRHLVPIACAWLGAIAALTLVPGWDPNSMTVGPAILLKVPSAAFAGGLLVPVLAKRTPVGFSVLALAMCFSFWPEGLTWQRWIASATAIFVVLDVSRLRISAPGFAAVGDWSYALYLCHLPIFLLAVKLVPEAALMVGFLTALAVGAGFGTLDVWLYTRLKRAMDQQTVEMRRQRLLWYLAIFSAAVPAALLIQ